MPRLPKFKASEAVAILIGVAFAAATLLWLSLDRAPPNWDDAWYLTNSLTVYDQLAHHGIMGYLRALNSVFGFKAPLIAALPTPFYLVLGRRWHAAFFVNIVSMLGLFWTLFKIATHYWSRRAAIIAVAAAGTMPLLYGLSHWYLVEYPLTALLAYAIWLLIQSEVSERAETLIWFGIVCGLGLLLKVSFAAFILPLFVYRWAKSPRRFRFVALPAIPCLLLALPWYSGHLLPTLYNAFDAGFGLSATIQGTGPIFALSTMLTYLSRIVSSGTSVYLAVLVGLLLVWNAFSRVRRATFQEVWKSAGPVLVFWSLPFLLFLFGGNKDIRYVAPLLPACALLIAGLLDSAAPQNLIGSVLVAVLLSMPTIAMLSVSFGLPYRSGELTYARPFNRIAWPLDPILKAIAADTSVKLGEKETVLVGVDRGSLNANNVELTAVELELPFTIDTTAHERNLDTLQLKLAQASYFLYKEGGEPEEPAVNPYAADLARFAIADPNYREIFSTPLPDGGAAHILRRRLPR